MSTAVNFSTIVGLFVALADKYGDSGKPYLLRRREGKFVPFSHSDVAAMAGAFAHGLKKLGIDKGNRIAILSENRPEWVVTDLAALAIGAVDVPIFPSQTAKQIEFILQDARTDAIVVSNPLQLNKVLKIRGDVPSLRQVIVMNPPEGGLDAGVLAFEEVLQSGRDSFAADPGFWKSAAAAARPQDLCTIIYTSGTTGNPKGVMLSHGNFVSNIASSAEVLPIGPEDRLLSFLPLCHVFERMAGYYTASACGASIAFADSIDTVADNLLEVHPTIVCSVPRLFERIYGRIAKRIEKDSPAKRRIFYWAVRIGREYRAALRRRSVPLSLRARHRLADRLVFSKLRERTGGSIRFFVSGGAALARELGEFFEAVGILIIEGYGLTESSPVIAANRLDNYKFGSVGHPIPGVEVRIADDGEILTRGPHIMMGYYNNRKSTEEVIDSEGWLHTGDIGTIDSAGFLFITDRKKHLFVSSGGKNIAPQPIESLFAGNEFIDQFILIGDKRMFLTALIVPDFQVLREYADAHKIPYQKDGDLVNNAEIRHIVEERIQHAQKDLANYERVRRFTLLSEPLTIENGGLTPSHKIKRNVVEERYRDLIEAMYQTAGK